MTTACRCLRCLRELLRVTCGCLRGSLWSYLLMLKTKYLFWEGILRKRSSLAGGSGLSRYLELQVFCYVTQCPWHSVGMSGLCVPEQRGAGREWLSCLSQFGDSQGLSTCNLTISFACLVTRSHTDNSDLPVDA